MFANSAFTGKVKINNEIINYAVWYASNWRDKRLQQEQMIHIT